MSKGSKTSNEPWKGAKPYLLGAANTLQGAYNDSAGALQNATNQVTSLLPSVIDKYKAGNSAVNAATNYASDVLGGKYLTGNPYLEQMIDRTNNRVMNQTQAALGLKGLTGGSDYAGLIADRLAQNESGMRYQDYANERQSMAQAAGMAPGLAAADTIQLQPTLSLLDAYKTPLNAASQYASGMGGLLGGYQTQGSAPSTGSQVAQGIGTALQIASLFAGSDVRLKENIRHIGQTNEGLPLYVWNYKGDPMPRIGPMAQEVAQMQPDALGPEVDGYMTVYYGRLN